MNPAADAARLATSEIKLVDIVLREHERRAEQNIGSLNFDASQSACGDGFLTYAKRALLEGLRGVNREVAQIFGLPEDDAIGDPFVDVAFVFAGQTQANDLDALAAGLLNR